MLYNHAQHVLAESYAKALERVAAETGLPAGVFPSNCRYTLDELLAGTVEM
ncbi:MAG: DUF29 family protein [Pirellulales bacterium]|nr:DUF29 family protein [Pirellulales bacterium]